MTSKNWTLEDKNWLIVEGGGVKNDPKKSNIIYGCSLAFLCNNCHGLMDSRCNFADINFSMVNFSHRRPKSVRQLFRAEVTEIFFKTNIGL